MMTQESISTATTRPLRTSICIVLHAGAVWKGLFFNDVEQAVNAIRGHYRRSIFHSVGNKSRMELTDKTTGQKYICQTVDSFLGMQDLKPSTEIN